MCRAILALLFLALSGCAALRDPTERAWQAAHIVDAIQTDHIVDDPCYSEGHPMTRAVVGANPSHEKVYAWAIAGAVEHALVANFLLNRGYTKAARVWQYVTLADTGYSLYEGYRVGVRIGSPNTRRIENGCRP